MENLLKINGLRVHFDTLDGPIEALHSVSLSVNEGQIMGVVGESGCGKSVTSLVTIGLASCEVDEGSVVFDGKELIHKAPESTSRTLSKLKLISSFSALGIVLSLFFILFNPDSGIIALGVLFLVFAASSITMFLIDTPSREHRKFLRSVRGNKISMIFQEPGTSLNPVYRTGDQVMEAIRLHQDVSKDEARNRTIELYREVGIPEPERRIASYPHEMSGGQKQRVMIAMALSCNPKLLIADEPTTALDVTIQAQVLRLISDLVNRLQLTVLLITHNLGVVAKTCEKAAVMYAGRVVEQAPVKELFRNPQHPYTRGLIQAVPTRQTLRGSLEGIPGLIPNLNNPPQGCRFNPRCAEAKAVCRQDVPRLAHIAETHSVSCHLY